MNIEILLNLPTSELEYKVDWDCIKIKPCFKLSIFEVWDLPDNIVY